MTKQVMQVSNVSYNAYRIIALNKKTGQKSMVQAVRTMQGAVNYIALRRTRHPLFHINFIVEPFVSYIGVGWTTYDAMGV
jgi:hypothetical protein